MGRSLILALLVAVACRPTARAQVIEFEQNGLRYQTLTRNGLTIMFAPLPTIVRDYSVIQVAVSNGSGVPRIVKPEDFQFLRPDAPPLAPAPPRLVVEEMLEKGSRSDVIRLVTTYEIGLYGLNRLNSPNGYEQRRQAALAEVSSTKIKAAAATSAIAFVLTRLAPGETTDGALFFSTVGRPLGSAKLQVRAAGDLFQFEPLLPAAGTP